MSGATQLWIPIIGQDTWKAMNASPFGMTCGSAASGSSMLRAIAIGEIPN